MTSGKGFRIVVQVVVLSVSLFLPKFSYAFLIVFEQKPTLGSSDNYEDICIINSDGTGFQNLTNNSIYPDFNAQWSPDGQSIAFASNRYGGTGKLDTYIMDYTGANVVNVTNDPNYEYGEFTWSPDSQQIIVKKHISPSETELIRYNADGTGEQKITTTQDHYAYPDWSPVGNQLAYYSFNTNNVNVMDIDGTNITPFDQSSREPFFSPDGSKVLFSSSGTPGLIIADADGGNRTVIFDQWVHSYAWSPDGKQIAFSSSYGAAEAGASLMSDAIFVVDVDGTNLRRVSDYIDSASYLDWSPDQSLIVFQSRDTQYQNQLYLLDMNAQGISQLTYEGSNGRPSFQPGWNDTNVVPEPASMALFGIGLLGAGAIRKRRNIS